MDVPHVAAALPKAQRKNQMSTSTMESTTKPAKAGWNMKIWGPLIVISIVGGTVVSGPQRRHTLHASLLPECG